MTVYLVSPQFFLFNCVTHFIEAKIPPELSSTEEEVEETAGGKQN